MRPKLALLALAVLALTVASLVAYDIYDDRAHSLLVLGQTPLLAESHPLHYAEMRNRVLTTLPAGSRPEVLRIRYGKDYMAIRVRTDESTEGWVIYDSSVELSQP